LPRPPPRGVAARWCGDSQRRRQGHAVPHGLVLGAGQHASGCPWAAGPQGKGPALRHGEGWRWQQPPWEAGVSAVRRQAARPTSGQVTVVMVDEPGQDRCSLRGWETARSAPQLMRRGRRRRGLAVVLRTLKPLWATASGQGPSEEAYYGPRV
jgi:hypothetical protein